MMPDTAVTLATYMYTTDTMMLAARLSDAGIEYFLADDNLISTQPFLSNAVGGVKVRVMEKDLQRALEILSDVEALKNSENKSLEATWKGYKKVTVFCPECDSSNVYRKNASFFSSFGAREHVCADCGHIWKY
jgi:putative signal transducing protein